MKFNRKKWDELIRSAWAVLCIASIIAFAKTEESSYGFLMLFCLIYFLHEDREYKQKYPDPNNNQ